MKYVYVMISQTGTIVSRFFKLVTRAKYNHASFSFDDGLHNMHSFGRRYLYFPFYGGYVTEDVDKGVYKRFGNVDCMVFRIPVTDDKIDKVKKELEFFEREYRRCTYNFLGLVTCVIHKPYERKYKYFCSQFVAYLLRESGIVEFKKSVSFVRPMDFVKMSALEKVFEGKLNDYKELVLNQKALAECVG